MNRKDQQDISKLYSEAVGRNKRKDQIFQAAYALGKYLDQKPNDSHIGSLKQDFSNDRFTEENETFVNRVFQAGEEIGLDLEAMNLRWDELLALVSDAIEIPLETDGEYVNVVSDDSDLKAVFGGTPAGFH